MAAEQPKPKLVSDYKRKSQLRAGVQWKPLNYCHTCANPSGIEWKLSHSLSLCHGSSSVHILFRVQATLLTAALSKKKNKAKQNNLDATTNQNSGKRR